MSFNNNACGGVAKQLVDLAEQLTVVPQVWEGSDGVPQPGEGVILLPTSQEKGVTWSLIQNNEEEGI